MNYDFSTIVIEDRESCERVVSIMRERLARYDFTTVSDFYTLVDKDVTYVDDRWGWIYLPTILIREAPGGFNICLPKPELLRTS